MSEKKTEAEQMFYNAHSLMNSGVFFVEIYTNGEISSTGVFSTAEKAKEWADSHDEYDNALICPYVIDVPEFGNIMKPN